MYSLAHYKNLQRYRPLGGWRPWRGGSYEYCSKQHGQGCRDCVTCHFCR